MQDTFPRISELVPHHPPMCLLDAVIAADAESLTAILTVNARGPFGNGLSVPGWVGIEYMAQAVAAWAGLKSAQAGGGPRLGFLLGTRHYRAHVPEFADGSRLHVEVRCELFADNGLGSFACRIFSDRQPFAEAQLSVFEPADAETYLKESNA